MARPADTSIHAASTARAVFPTPPTPASVTTVWRPSAAAISPSSAFLPTKEDRLGGSRTDESRPASPPYGDQARLRSPRAPRFSPQRTTAPAAAATTSPRRRHHSRPTRRKPPPPAKPYRLTCGHPRSQKPHPQKPHPRTLTPPEYF